MNRRSFVSVVALVAVAALAVAGWSWMQRPKPQQLVASDAQPSVGVRPVAAQGVSQAFEFVGRIKAIEKVEVRARVEGFLEKVLFREGQAVKAGDLLYRIEKVQFQALVDQAQANLVAAEAMAVNAKVEHERALELSTKNFGSIAKVDQAVANLATANGKVLQEKAAL
ncbi:MAG TPA: biotin/lipoyl-binding protein, partial [Reyranella sp.]